MARRLALALCVALALLAPAGVFAQEPQTNLADIEDEVMCPICGVSLELATEAPQAIQQREFIRTLIAEGLTKDEIKDRLVAEYGSEVLAVPEAEGFDLAAWLVPGAAILIAGGAIGVAVRRWRRSGRGGPPPSSGDGASAGESERLDADLARYEL
jgi:cytochrome c-type biogenesis protein CcmH/NrfF